MISRVENDNQIYSTIVGKIEPDGARFWGLNLASNEKVSREQQFVRPKINSTKEGVEVGRLPREFYFAPGQGGQICTNDDGSILTISRDALQLTDDKDGSITGPPATPVPQVYSVHTDFVSGLHTSPVDFLQFSRILAGNRFHKDDPRFSGLQIERGPRILKFSDPATPNWVQSFEFEPAIAYDKDKAQASDTTASSSKPDENLVGFFSPELKVLQEFEYDGLTDLREVSLAEKTIELSLLQPDKSIPDMDGISVSVLVTIANCSSSTLFYTLVVADGDLPSQANTVNCDTNLKEATDGSFTDKLDLQGDQDWLAVNPKFIGLATWTEQKPHLALVIETQDDRHLRVPIQLHPETIIKLLDNILKATLSVQHGNNANLTSVCYNMESCKNGNSKP